MKRFISFLVCAVVLLQCSAVSLNVSSVAPLEILTVDKEENSRYGYVDYRFKDKNGNEAEILKDLYQPQKASGEENKNIFELSGSTVYGNSAALPSSYDSRNNNYVTSAKSQGVSGNCWAFATMSMLESDSIIQGFATNPDYSEAHFSWFTSKSLTTNTNDSAYGDGKNEEEPFVAGGNWIIAAGSLARWTGAAKEADYPFYPQNLDAMGNYDEADRYDRGGGVVIKSAELLGDMNDIKQWITDHGSASLAFYYDTAFYNKSTCSYYYNGDNSLNHQIAVIGWDDNYQLNNFKAGTRPESNGAWLCKNSWDTNWGDDGYFWISYYDTSVSQFSGVSSQSAENLYNNYTYNGAGWESYVTHEGNAKLSNVFTAKEYELITAVSAYTMASDTELSICVYKNLPAGFRNPEAGELTSELTVTIPRAGFHTFDLDTVVEVEPGTKFSVVVEYISDGTVYFPVEVNGQGANAYSSNAGESYVYLPYYNKGWYDAQAYGLNNIFIQAFTRCNHRITQEKTDATCSADGYEKIFCTQCGTVESEGVLPMLTHNFSEWSGYKHDILSGREVNTRACEYCGYTETMSYISGKNVITIDRLFDMIFERFFELTRELFKI